VTPVIGVEHEHVERLVSGSLSNLSPSYQCNEVSDGKEAEYECGFGHLQRQDINGYYHLCLSEKETVKSRLPRYATLSVTPFIILYGSNGETKP